MPANWNNVDKMGMNIELLLRIETNLKLGLKGNNFELI